jgi:predicted DNA-binding protein with PD1-like motif
MSPAIRCILARRFSPAALALGCLSCASQSSPGPSAPVVRWLKPSETAPQGRAPGAKVRLLTTQSDGTKTYVLVLSQGDQVQAAIAAFAKDDHVVDAHFSAIGAIRDPEVAWFDETRKQYKAMSLHEQMEVLTLSGDITLGVDGQPVVHTHLVLARSDGEAWGGHLIEATTSPTLELYVTAYPEPLHKRLDPATDLQLIDPSLERQGRLAAP